MEQEDSNWGKIASFIVKQIKQNETRVEIFLSLKLLSFLSIV